MPANPVLTPERFQLETEPNRPGWGAPTGAVGGAGTPASPATGRPPAAPIERGRTMTIAGTLSATGVA